MGVFLAPELPHPHPNPPLEGEGVFQRKIDANQDSLLAQRSSSATLIAAMLPALRTSPSLAYTYLRLRWFITNGSKLQAALSRNAN
ncbi:MAG: hypothetical protein A2075_03210 [Geobacteraceae bacterium GWC2_58_44]|nr:MAG: hypothetical protein A2075_03210 [Geobacteraceae bacterium GWC2_58_44]